MRVPWTQGLPKWMFRLTEMRSSMAKLSVQSRGSNGPSVWTWNGLGFQPSTALDRSTYSESVNSTWIHILCGVLVAVFVF
jgi:hypothetical protein